jgi:Zinc-finger associated domain (zf-AD)
MSVCRSCGEEKSPLDLVVELSDKTRDNCSYTDLIEYHARVTLKTNKLLPQGICEDCREQIDKFVTFSARIQSVQDIFERSDENIGTKECYVRLENMLGDVVAEPITADDNAIQKNVKVDIQLSILTFF